MLGNEKNPCRKLSRSHEKNPNYYQNAILQNLSEQDTCFDSKDLIDCERNAVDLYAQRDSKGQISFVGFKEGFP